MSDKELTIQGADALFQIAEPQKVASRVARREGVVVGIDLGTTHSLVAIAPHGAPPKVLGDKNGEVLVPSVVSYADHKAIVGSGARCQATEHPEHVIVSVKRFMGRAPAEIGFRHPYRLVDESGPVVRFDLGDGQHVSPVEVSAEILRELKRRAEALLGEPVTAAVITVPAYFDDAQRQATKDAGRVAGLDVLRLLAEPTAAALAYGLDRKSQGLFAVYDLGGGTFDISILRLKAGVFQVLATGGDTALGGDDFDRELVEDFKRQLKLVAPTPSQMQSLLLAARRIKEELTTSEFAAAVIPGCGKMAVEVTRHHFESLIAAAVKRTTRACKQALRDAGLTIEELDGVVLVGGSTRVPIVRRHVAEFFGSEPLTNIDPDKVVAYGAAISADILSGNARDGVTLLDVVPLSLGIETMGGIVEKLIARNASIPISARQTFTNYSEMQTGMTFHVVQGERELAKDCRSLATFELKGIPKLPPSMARVEVTFQLDADGLLSVTARELMTGVKQTVDVKPTYGLGNDEVDQLVADSLDHASEDFGARNIAEARVELGRVALAVRAVLDEGKRASGLVSDSERELLEAMLRESDAAMADERADSERLRSTMRLLEKESEPVARRRMERALHASMAGKSLSNIEDALAKEASAAAASPTALAGTSVKSIPLAQLEKSLT